MICAHIKECYAAYRGYGAGLHTYVRAGMMQRLPCCSKVQPYQQLPGGRQPQRGKRRERDIERDTETETERERERGGRFRVEGERGGGREGEGIGEGERECVWVCAVMLRVSC